MGAFFVLERGDGMLTEKQEKFVQGIIEGKSQADAYRAAYNTNRMSDKSVWELASRLMNDVKVVSRLKELRDQIAGEKIMSAAKRAQRLTEFATDADPNVAMKAIDLLNKMTGEYVQRVEADVKSDINISIELSDDE